MILAVRRLLDNKDKNEKGVIKIVSDMWKDFDTDGNGKLNRLETFKFVNHFFKSQGKPEATNAAFDQLFKKFDANGDGFISK